MTRLVVRVRDPDEVAVALAGGADAVEVSAPADIVRQVVEAVAGRRPVIAVASTGGAAALASCGADIVRVGTTDVAAAAGRGSLLASLLAAPGDDGEATLASLPGLKAAGAIGAVLDVGTSGGRLLDHVPMLMIGRFVAQCRAENLECGLAGGLESPDVPRLLLLEPDMLMFSAALRSEDDALDRSLLRLIRGQIPPDLAGADGADYRLLAGRGQAPRADSEPAPADRIFVHDFVLPVRIGAYAHERLEPQPVRFNVDVVVTHGRNPTDLRDVLSYDVITDGIGMLVAAGHVPLVETLAERIATMLLTHPRVLRVVVRLEKLATGAGIVGVEIERGRPARAALSPGEEQRTR